MRGFEWERKGGWLLSQSRNIGRSVDLEASSSRQYIDPTVFYPCKNSKSETSPRSAPSEKARGERFEHVDQACARLVDD
jgi:hypothetical protein